MLTLNDIFKYAGFILLFINVILFYKSHNRFTKIMAFKLIFTYLVISLIFSLNNERMNYFRINNLFLSHFYFIFQFVLLSAFYLLLLNKRQKRFVIIIYFIVLSILGGQYMLKPKELFGFNLFEVFITSFPLVIYSVIHLYNSLTSKGVFLYFNAAILIYISSSTLIFFLGNYLAIFEQKVVINIWFIHKILYLVFLILIFLEWKNSFSSHKTKT